MTGERPSRVFLRLVIHSLAGLALLFLHSKPLSAAEGADEDPYRPGIVAHYKAADGRHFARLQEQPVHARDDVPRPFSVHYRGRLWTQTPGTYRLHVFAAGSVRLSVDGRRLLDTHSDQPRWLDATPIELEFGYHPLEVDYRRDAEPARLALYWQGPQFGLEPVSARWLFHDANDSPPHDFERGERLARALRCAACHDWPGESQPLRAPALNSLAANLSRAWLVDWLAETRHPQPGSDIAVRQMPHYAFRRDEAEAIADALLAASEPVPSERKLSRSDSPKSGKDAPPPSVADGETLFRTVGCLACHRVGELGTSGPFGGGDLSRIASKRPADFFARWMAEPARVNIDHRMPVFALAPHEQMGLSLYLQSLGGPARPAAAKSFDRLEAGTRLVREARCAACHRLPKSLAADSGAKRTKLDAAALADNTQTCLAEPGRTGFRPGYRLSEADRRAIEVFVSGIAMAHTPSAEQLLAENNCLACHARGSAPGLAAHLTMLAEADPALAPVLPALVPPTLSGVGDKLNDEALAATIRRSASPHRDWLRVRMPRFSLSDREIESLVRYFVAVDRIPPRAGATPPEESSRATMEAAGPRLVTADGFGCTSCHAIGDWTPQRVELGAQGSPLSAIGRRIRRQWFDRWVRDPARIVARIEMPAVQRAVPGVLAGRLDHQLAAVWHALNRENFTPPAPNALRVVRRANLRELGEPAVVLTDVMEVGGRPFVKPLVIGLPNRQNLLFDLATGRLAAWWTGDVARQNTRGKSWYWEAGQPQLFALASRPSGNESGDLLLVRRGAPISPVPAGQYVTELDSLIHVDGGVRLAHRLHFPLDGSLAVVRVVQEFAPLTAAPGRQSGFRRRVQIEGTPGDAAWELLALAGEIAVDSTGRSATLAGPSGKLETALAKNDSAPLVKTSRGAVVAIVPNKGQPVACELEYRSESVPDEFPPLAPIDRRVERAELQVVPGFEAVRLALTSEAMPTGFAWRGDGTLVVSSLEGRVWLAHDDDGDGLEERLVPFSDELAAPYGVAISGKAVDVISKYALLRLFDEDGDGRAERVERLASGWGHTVDYHDWAVGLPRDPEGNYYVSLACRQDDRTPAAENLRGTVVRLVPRTPTADDPQKFELEPIAAGLRFAQGIALSKNRELFVTDNQGHYTPFNELNHVVAGAHYGFLDRRTGAQNPKGPFRPAAVEIPHPWTRSVNGICFLETPEAVRENCGHDRFGPFEGHLVACEYDTRRLVRLSLEKVGEDFQGAVYPFSIEPRAGQETFEGPLICGVAPDGDLYIGNIRDSGWGAGTNTGSIVRMRRRGDLPPGIAEVRAARDGFTIYFTKSVDRRRAADLANYSVSSFRRLATPAYGGDDKERRVETIRSAALSDDAERVTLELGELREGFVYEFHLRSLAGDGLFFPGEAYYTLRHRIP